MSLSIGASSNVLSSLQSLLTQGIAGIGDAVSSGSPLSALFQSLSGSSPAPQSPTTAAGVSAPGSTFGAGTMAALLSLQGQPATGTTAQSLFSKIDSNDEGQISKSEFESALGNVGFGSSTADTVFDQLDTNGDGSISASELASAKPARGHHHHHMHAGGGQSVNSSSSSSSSSSSADGTTTQSTTNPDGSTTTTVTYADGSSVVTTTPVAAQTGSGTPGTGASGQSNANLLQQLLQLQAQLVSAASSTLSSLV